ASQVFTELLNDHERAYLEEVRQFCRTQVDPFCEQWEKDENLPDEIFAQAGKAGLMGLMAPKEVGGRGVTFNAYTQIIKELASHLAALAENIAAHNSLCLGQILAFGSEAQRERYVTRLASGEWHGAWALTEPQGGSDSRNLETTGIQTSDGWELTGHKM